MSEVYTTFGVMTAPNGRKILDEIYCTECAAVRITRRSTKNYEMVVVMQSGFMHTLQFDAAAGGDVMLTAEEDPDEPIAA